MKLRASWEAANCAATQELPSVLWNPKVHYRPHKSPPLVPFLSQIDPIPTIPSYLSKINFNIVHPPTSWSFQWSLDITYYYLFIIIISGVGLSPLGTAATSGLLCKPQKIDEGDCGAIGGMKIGRGNRSTRRKPTPAPLCPQQIPLDQTRAPTRAAAVGSQRPQRLTAWAMARPLDITYLHISNAIDVFWEEANPLDVLYRTHTFRHITYKCI
jgi:hypothetical protein